MGKVLPIILFFTAEIIQAVSSAGTCCKKIDEECEEHFGVHVEYEDYYAALVFLLSIYLGGLFAARFLKMPALVGEIIVGILLGPPLADYVPYAEAFVMFGEIGLIFLVVEAGIDIDLVTLKLVGSRGCLIAVFGSIFPILIAMGVALILGAPFKDSIAAGACFGPTSLGIALNILREGNVLNTPTGQMIIAAAIIDDMIALVILSQLGALNGSIEIEGILIPIISALGFLLVGGYIAIVILPPYIEKIQEKFEPEHRGYVSTTIMMALVYALLPATKYTKASHLMGAFIAGLVFCSDHDLHHNFVRQYKRLMQWLIRVFFSAAIGFQVPIKDMFDGKIIYEGLLLTLALTGKLAVGFLVPNFSQSERFKGVHFRDCLIVGFSMMAEGEFAFVIAVYAVSNELISEDLYASIILAVLLSTIIAPFSLRYIINKYASHTNDKVKAIEGEMTPLEGSESSGAPLFLCIQTQSAATWGLFSNILRSMQEMKLDIIDHRSFHPHGDEYLANEIYAKDAGFEGDSNDEEKTRKRLHDIETKLLETINQPDATVQVGRWALIKPDTEADNITEKVANFDFCFNEARRLLDEHTRHDAVVVQSNDDFWGPIEEDTIKSRKSVALRNAPSNRIKQPSTGNTVEGRQRRMKQCSHNMVSRLRQEKNQVQLVKSDSNPTPRGPRRRQLSMPIGHGLNDVLGGPSHLFADIRVANRKFVLKMDEPTFEAIKAAEESGDLEKIVLKHETHQSVENELGGFVRSSVVNRNNYTERRIVS